MKFFKLRYLLLLLPLVSGAFHAIGQKKGFDNLIFFDERKLHFGFYLGLNTMDYRLSSYKNIYENPVFAQQQALNNPSFSPTKLAEVYHGKSSFATEIYSIKPGFSVGGVINARLGRDFDLRFTPGMSLGDRYFTFIPVELPDKQFINDNPKYLIMPSAYVDVPFGIRYKGFRHRNLRPYIYTGASYRFDIFSSKTQDRVAHLKKNGKYAEIGLGLDSYLEYFRFTVEFRFSYGLDNLIRHDTGPENIPYYGYIFKELNSNIFTLIFYFE